MILASDIILENLNDKIIIKPFNQKNLQSYSYDMHLSEVIYEYHGRIIDVKKNNRTKKIVIGDNGFVLRPNKVYVASTCEYTETYGFIPFIEGRSSLARLGLSIHSNAPYGGVGYKGVWTLELTCHQKIRIYKNMKVCQIMYQSVIGNPTDYNNKYQGSIDAVPSKAHSEF